MWLSGPTAQLRPLHVAKRDPFTLDYCRFDKRQMTLILMIPMLTLLILRRTEGASRTDHTSMAGFGNASMKWICSLSLQLAYLLLERNRRNQPVWWDFCYMTKEILHLLTVEQDQQELPYRFVRDTDRKEDTFAMMVLSWLCCDRNDLSAFRPSDDCCQYSYWFHKYVCSRCLGYVQKFLQNWI